MTEMARCPVHRGTLPYLARMAKYWNNHSKHGEKPIKPSFLIEVMALEYLYGGWVGQFDREMQSFFATLF